MRSIIVIVGCLLALAGCSNTGLFDFGKAGDYCENDSECADELACLPDSDSSAYGECGKR